MNEMDDEAPQGADEQQVTAKTPLGRYILQLEFARTPDAVLQARAKLAIQIREEAMKTPEEKEKERKEAEEEAKKAAKGGNAESGESELAPPTPDPLAVAAQKLGVKVPDELLHGAGAGEGRQPTKAERKAGDRYRLLVVGGDWAGVAAWLKNEAGADAGSIYAHTLTGLQSDAAMVPEEVLLLADAAPVDLTDKQVTTLGQILRSTVARGGDAGNVSLQLVKGPRTLGGTQATGRARAARLLMAADLPVEAKPFLDPLEQARADKNAALINLHAMYFKGLAARKTDPAEKKQIIQQSWGLCLESLAISSGKTIDRVAAVERCIEFIDELPLDQGDAWLKSLFAGDADLAWKAIEKANQKARANRVTSRPPDERLRGLLVLSRMAKAMVSSGPEVASNYRTALDMLSLTVLEEAEDSRRRRTDERFQCIPPEQIGQVLPDGAWLRAASPGLAAKLETMTAQVTLGAGDLDGVLDLIRPLATTDVQRASKLAESVIVNWPNYVKPGSAGGEEDGAVPMYNPYARRSYYNMSRYNYGYNNGGTEGAIPLTRARQRRFLDQLAAVHREFQALKLPHGTTQQIVNAFAVSHSDAEVYRTPDIELVFGSVNDLPTEASIELADTMRKRLGGLWRKPKTQEENATKRTDAQLAAEVERGYALAHDLAAAAFAKDAESWKAATLLADLSFDTAEFLYGQKADLATYSAHRQEAFAAYTSATALYARELASGKTQASSRSYFQWFSSALGASDLGFLTRQDQPNMEQIDRVIAAIAELPENQRARHLALFAKDVDSAVSTLAPELKVRFLTQAGRVVGDHPAGAATRKLLAYYNDLQKEVELNLVVDGPSQVGSTDPFGARLAVWTTRAVSRESGGFSKYILNQQWNQQTGQQVDYKDELEKKIRESLRERFDVVSITFHKPGTPPMGVQRDGWEQHPLAYLVLKPKDASVDRIPQLKMDLDFSDGHGMVILPVVSGITLIDAKGESPLRPVTNLEVTQTLDERKAASGVVTLDILARGKGLIGGLTSLVDLSVLPSDLEVASREDHGVNVADLDMSGSDVLPVAERSWTLTLKPKPGVGSATFAFPAAVAKTTKLENKHYTDADIALVQAPIALAFDSNVSYTGWYIGAGACVALAAAGFFAWRMRKPVEVAAGPRFTLPADLTPVAAVGLLRTIARATDLALPETQQRQIASEIEAIERCYFARSGDAASVDLHATASRWVKVAEAARR
jgi:hypothetical protein